MITGSRRLRPLAAASFVVWASAGASVAQPPDGDELWRLGEREKLLQRELEAATARTDELATLKARLDPLVAQLIPPCAAGDEDVLRQFAARRGLARVEVAALAGPHQRFDFPDLRPPVEARRLTIIARDSYPAVARFLSQSALGTRFVVLETVKLHGEADGNVRLGAVAVLPCTEGSAGRPPAAPTAAAPNAGTDAVAAARARVAALEGALRASQEAWTSTQGVILLMDRFKIGTGRGARLGAALDTFAREAGAGHVSLQDVAFGEVVSLLGTADGLSRAQLLAALEKAGFADTRLEVAPAGRCQSFTVEARIPDDLAVPDAPPPSGGTPFDAAIAARCR